SRSSRPPIPAVWGRATNSWSAPPRPAAPWTSSSSTNRRSTSTCRRTGRARAASPRWPGRSTSSSAEASSRVTTIYLARHGETLEAFRDRVLEALAAISAQHDGADVLVVAHGGCVRTVQRHLLGEPLATLENCGVYVVGFENGVLRPID